MVGGNPALAIRRSGQRHLRRFAGHEVLDLDGVSHRVDVRIGGLQMLIDLDATTRTDPQPRIDRQLVFGTHPDPQDHQLSRQTRTRLQHDREVSRPLLECLGGLAQQQRHASGYQVLGERCRHLLVEGRQYLILQLDHRDPDAPAHQVLDQLETDEPRPHHDRPLDPMVDATLDLVHVLQVAQGEDARQVDTGNRRPQGSPPGARISLS